MKSMDLRAMSDEELGLAEKNTAEELWKLKFQHHTGQLGNTSTLERVRKTLARIQTIRSERRLGLRSAPSVEG